MPGHHTRQGTLTPPSQVDPFPPRRGPFEPPSNGPIPECWLRYGFSSPVLAPIQAPLSEIKIARVLFEREASPRTTSSIDPMLASISSTASPYVPLREIPMYSGPVKSGTWGYVLHININSVRIFTSCLKFGNKQGLTASYAIWRKNGCSSPPSVG